MGRLLLPLILAATALACGDDTTPGFRGECVNAGGALGCETGPIETSTDACWKLVDCGVIVIDNENDYRNWSGCVNEIDRMSSERQSIVLKCIEVATCDDLRARPDGTDQSSICGEFGEQ